MRDDFERRIVRNPAAGAVLLWTFADAYVESCGRGPNLAEISLVLPMAFHEATVRKIKRMQKSTGLGRAVSQEPDICSGLEIRVDESLNLTLEATAVAMSAGLLSRETASGLPQFVPVAKLPVALEKRVDDYKDQIAACRRLGNWFGADGLTRTCSQLRVSF